MVEKVREVKKARTAGGVMRELLEGQAGKAEGASRVRNLDLYLKNSKKHHINQEHMISFSFLKKTTLVGEWKMNGVKIIVLFLFPLCK